MHVLISNDDGVHSPGIYQLAHHLAKIATVTVVAPDRQQSATSHAITLHKPLHVDVVDLGDEITAFQVNGTPADCVKLGLGASLCGETTPDLVISGINNGANLGLDIIYSGTASAAAEAALQGVPAIAVSLTDKPFDFSAAVLITERLAKAVVDHGLMPNTYLNVNIPPGNYGSLAGMVITRIGERKYKGFYERRTDPLGRSYYWQAGQLIAQTPEPDTDVWAIDHNLVSVTPVHFDFTNTTLLATLKSWQLTL